MIKEEELFEDISAEEVAFMEYKVLKDTTENRIYYVMFLISLCFVLSCIVTVFESFFIPFTYPVLFLNMPIVTGILFFLHFYFHFLPSYYDWRHYMR